MALGGRGWAPPSGRREQPLGVGGVARGLGEDGAQPGPPWGGKQHRRANPAPGSAGIRSGLRGTESSSAANKIGALLGGLR